VRHGRLITVVVKESFRDAKTPITTTFKNTMYQQTCEDLIRFLIERNYASSNEIKNWSMKYRPNGRSPFDSDEPLMEWLIRGIQPTGQTQPRS